MDHLTVPVLLFLLSALLLQHAAPAPSNRYVVSSSEQTDDVLEEEEGWMAPHLSTTPFLRFAGSRPQRALAAVSSHQHHIEKRKCNTATCVTQRLADFLVRSSNSMGTIYAPTNVGSSTYGKRALLPMSDSLVL